MTQFILSVVIGLIVLIGIVVLLNKIPKKLQIIVKALLLVAIVFFGYQLYQSIAEPVKFNKVKDERYKKVIANLIQLREAQNAHKLIVGRYSDDINALAKFVDTAQLAITERRDSSIVDREKNRRFGLNAQTGGYYKEITITDTLGFESVKSKFEGIDVAKLLDYPFEGAPGKIKLETDFVQDDDLTISVFRAMASKKDILWDQSEKLLEPELKIKAVEAIDGEDIIVGSLDEVSTSGNWPRQYAINDDK